MRALRNKKALTEHKYYHDSEHILVDFHQWDEVIPFQSSLSFCLQPLISILFPFHYKYVP